MRQGAVGAQPMQTLAGEEPSSALKASWIRGMWREEGGRFVAKWKAGQPSRLSATTVQSHGKRRMCQRGRRCGPGESHLITRPLSTWTCVPQEPATSDLLQASTSTRTRIRYTAYTNTIYPAYTTLHIRQPYTYICSWPLAASTRAGETPADPISGHPSAPPHLATTLRQRSL